MTINQILIEIFMSRLLVTVRLDQFSINFFDFKHQMDFLIKIRFINIKIHLKNWFFKIFYKINDTWPLFSVLLIIYDSIQ